MRLPRLPARSPVRAGFVRSESGATAVEFALIAIPFIVLLFAIIQTALVYLAGGYMETAVADAARLIRTGQAQKGGFDRDAFKASVCERMTVLFDCADGLRLDVRTAASFSATDLAEPIKDGKLDTDDFAFDAGAGGDIVIVRAFYEWPVLGDLFGFSQATLANGKRLLSAVVTFRNEPFPWGTGQAEGEG